MTGCQSDPDGSAGPDGSASRSATIRTDVDEAETLAASVRPDNTPEIDTRVEYGSAGDDGSGTVVTTVERETTGGLRTTVDDYVVNLTVAQKVVQAAKRFTADADDQNSTSEI